MTAIKTGPVIGMTLKIKAYKSDELDTVNVTEIDKDGIHGQYYVSTVEKELSGLWRWESIQSIQF